MARVSKSPQQEASRGSPRGDVAKSPFNARTRPRRPSSSGSRLRSHVDLYDRLPPRKNIGFSRIFTRDSLADFRRVLRRRRSKDRLDLSPSGFTRFFPWNDEVCLTFRHEKYGAEIAPPGSLIDRRSRDSGDADQLMTSRDRAAI